MIDRTSIHSLANRMADTHDEAAATLTALIGENEDLRSRITELESKPKLRLTREEIEAERCKVITDFGDRERDRVPDVVQDGLHALWAAVAGQHPDYSGDLSVEADERLYDAVYEAVDEWIDTNRPTLRPGTRVQLIEDAERFPHFIAPAGATGYVESHDLGVLVIKMDNALDNCSEWDNCVIFTAEEFDNSKLQWRVLVKEVA